jgi:hypothetical protein
MTAFYLPVITMPFSLAAVGAGITACSRDRYRDAQLSLAVQFLGEIPHSAIRDYYLSSFYVSMSEAD